jgi:hypothetical protein
LAEPQIKGGRRGNQKKFNAKSQSRKSRQKEPHAKVAKVAKVLTQSRKAAKAQRGNWLREQAGRRRNMGKGAERDAEFLPRITRKLGQKGGLTYQPPDRENC